jgi:threonine dehydrogenase-like Zn-dependent dehydrogenase
MTEMIVEEERYLHRVPSTLRDSAVLIEPLTISRKGLRQIRDIQDRLPWACSTVNASQAGGDQTVSRPRALVLGGGPVGLLGAMTLKDAGFQTSVYSHVGAVPERVQVANAIGCELIPSEETSPAELLDRVGKVDVIFEAAGASQLAFDVLELLGYNSIFVFTGVPGRKTRSSINTDLIMRNLVLKNQALVGTVNAAPEDFVNAIRSLERFELRWPGVPASLKTGALRLEDVTAALTGKGGKKGIKRYVMVA